MISKRKNNKYQNLSLPLIANDHPKNPRLCDNGSPGNENKRCSFEANQSLLNNFPQSPFNAQSKMEWVKGRCLCLL